MYSVVLLAAMTSTAEAPGFGDIWAKHCFWECCPPARYGSIPCGPGYQAPYYPTASYSCCGCGGWYYNGRSSCHGCYGANYASSSYACYGGYGGGCYGTSCHGTSYYNCYGGGIYQGIGYAGFGAYGNHGMYGAVPVLAAPMYTTPMIEVRSGATAKPLDPSPLEIKPLESRPLDFRPLDIPPTEIKPLEIKPIKSLLSNPNDAKASVVVRVPANAKVFIDNYPMKSTSTERVFTTPALQPGESYFYTIRVVVEKDGKEFEEVRRVSVRAGETSRLAFENLNDRFPRDDRAIVNSSKYSIK